MLTLANLVENINGILLNSEGQFVKSALEACKSVRELIQGEEFYHTLRDAGLEDILVFKDEIDQMDKVYLRTPIDDEKLWPIIKIDMQISYFDEEDLSKGGNIAVLKCRLVGEGKNMGNIPVEQMVLGLQFNYLKKQRDAIAEELDELQSQIVAKTEEKAQMDGKLAEISAKANELRKAMERGAQP